MIKLRSIVYGPGLVRHDMPQLIIVTLSSLTTLLIDILSDSLAILTAAMEMLSGPEAGKVCRKAEIMADAAYAILCKDPSSCTGNFFIDDEVLIKEGVTDFDQYLVDPGNADTRKFFYT